MSYAQPASCTVTLAPASPSFRTPQPAATFVELLRLRAAYQRCERALTYLVDGDSQEDHVTYAGLDEAARAIATVLQSMGAVGQRTLLLYRPGLDFIRAFLGCMYAGAVAVPVYFPRPGRPFLILTAIARDAEAVAVLTSSALIPAIHKHTDGVCGFAGLRLIATDRIEQATGGAWREQCIHEHTLVCLQYSSGSTGTPKGVMLTHGNLLHNSRDIYAACEHDAQSVAVSWLPHFHDMGLIAGLLQPLYGGFPGILLSTVAFAQRPVRWLNAISRYKATASGGPNSAYQLCAQKVTAEQEAALDLSSWRVAYNGAEPISGNTLDQFASRFGKRGFRREAFLPTYGLAEATLLVSGARHGPVPNIQTVSADALEGNRAVPAGNGDRNSRAIVGCGGFQPSQTVVIVEPETRCLRPAGAIGEIWVSGPGVSQGYWRRPQETEKTFGANLSDGSAGPFLRTGDLGFIQRGELFVTGRLKDLIIIGGRNHYPQDIETTVGRAHAALSAGCSVAFSVYECDEERLVVVSEVAHRYKQTPDAKTDFAEVASSVRRAVWENHDLPINDVVFVRRGSIPITSSGKVRRRACREAYLAGSLSRVADA